MTSRAGGGGGGGVSKEGIGWDQEAASCPDGTLTWSRRKKKLATVSGTAAIEIRVASFQQFNVSLCNLINSDKGF